MSEKLEEKAVEIIDKTLDNMDKLTVMLAEVAEKYGPEVVDAGLTVVRVSAGSTLIHAAIGTALIVALFKFGIPLTFKYRASLPESDRDNTEFFMPTFLCWVIAGVGVFGISLGGFGTLKLFNLWTWVALVEPKLWIAHRVLGW